jgi:hypothetical protein
MDRKTRMIERIAVVCAVAAAITMVPFIVTDNRPALWLSLGFLLGAIVLHAIALRRES